MAILPFKIIISIFEWFLSQAYVGKIFTFNGPESESCGSRCVFAIGVEGIQAIDTTLI
jgi:hypothetical protein